MDRNGPRSRGLAPRAWSWLAARPSTSPERWGWGLLIGGTVLTLIVGGSSVGGTADEARGRLDQVRDQRAAQVLQQETDRDERRAELAAVDPNALLEQVRTRNEEFSRTVKNWDEQGRPASGLSMIQQVQSACMAAIVSYDVVAARYADLLPPGLPAQIDLDQESLNCSATEFHSGGLLL